MLGGWFLKGEIIPLIPQHLGCTASASSGATPHTVCGGSSDETRETQEASSSISQAGDEPSYFLVKLPLHVHVGHNCTGRLIPGRDIFGFHT